MSKGVFWTKSQQLKVIYIFLLSQKHLCERWEACFRNPVLRNRTVKRADLSYYSLMLQGSDQKTQEPAHLNTSVFNMELNEKKKHFSDVKKKEV